MNLSKPIVKFRSVLAILSLIGVMSSLIDGTINPFWATGDWSKDFFGGFAYFTIQTNIFIGFWWTLAAIYSNNPDKLKKIMGKLRGGLCMYIFVTFSVFAILLQPTYIPGTTLAWFSNILLHYILPISFLVDWFLTEDVIYQWNYLWKWIIYPFVYLFFSLIYYELTGILLYPFLDYKYFPIGTFIIIILGLIVVFLIIACVIIALSRFTRGNKKKM